MSGYLDAQVIPTVIAVDGRVGLTLWAPSWFSVGGEEMQGFLGNGRQVLAFASAEQLAAYLAEHPDGDLSEHPAWPSMLRRQPNELRAEPENLVDFDDMFALLADEPTGHARAAVANAVQLAEAVAAACDDHILLEMLDRAPFQRVLLGTADPSARAGHRYWQELAQEVNTSWEVIVERLARDIQWVGDVHHVDIDCIRQPGAAASPWLGSQHRATASQYLDGSSSDAVLPSRAATVVVTLFFGLFGLIPAAIATGHARGAGIRTGRYWSAFWWTLLVSFLVQLLLVVLVVRAAVAAGS
jgi:hypothetical protein